MRGQTIGKTMPHGYAGSYARQPDAVVDTHPLAGDTAIVFGSALVYGTSGAVCLLVRTELLTVFWEWPCGR